MIDLSQAALELAQATVNYHACKLLESMRPDVVAKENTNRAYHIMFIAQNKMNELALEQAINIVEA